MKNKNSVGLFREKLNPYQGLLFALFSTVFAEAILHRFLKERGLMYSSGRAAIVFLSLWTVQRFAQSAFRQYRSKVRHLATITFLLLVSIVILAFGKVIGGGVTQYFEGAPIFGGCSQSSWHFAIPFATSALIVQTVLGLQFALVLSVSFSLIIALYCPGESFLAVYALITSLVSCLSLRQFRNRSAYIRAGVHTSLIAFPFAFASILIDQDLTNADLLVRLFGALISGVQVSFLAAGLTPIVEYLGGYATDLRLIEMATLDHPILKELSIQCPGTWNHSMVMGMMVEAAANACGANPVVTRVGAYFHDIGKIKKPLYFVENQAAGENRHDKLSPSMSALIIRSHVKDGIELAKKHGLPKLIEDMIPQHHGRSIIEYFYEKACREAEEGNESIDSVDIGLYSYPGPRPQTKEAGILMLADGIEAATRTLVDPSLDRIQGLVQKMINKVFASGELEECELTLKDLHIIAKSFTRVLTGIYHQRVAYAEPAEKVHESSEKSVDKAGSHSEQDQKGVEGRPGDKRQKGQTEERADKEDSTEDLKRLGL